MLDTRIGRVAGFLFGVGLLVAALVLVRIHRSGAASGAPAVDPRQTDEIVHDRMVLQRELMRQERLNLSSR